jgi:hypothetical protein
MTLWFEISPHGVQDGNMAPTPTAYVIRPAGIDYQRPMARTRGANPKMNLAVSLAMTFVVQGENGPEVRTYNPTGFAYENVALGSRNLSYVGQPSAVMPAPPQEVGATIAIAVTEKGPGGDYYTDIAGALESSKDAVQTLIEHYYGGD